MPSIPRGLAGSCLVLALSSALGQPQFLDLTTLPPPTPGTATGISGDGVVVTGRLAGYRPAYRWSYARGVEPIEPLETGIVTSGRALNRDGTVLAGMFRLTATDWHAFRWTEESGLIPLGELSGSAQSWVTGISGDGSVVVGYGYDGKRQAFRWTTAGGMQSLIPGAQSSEARAISADGGIIIGSSDAGFFRWTVETGPDYAPLNVLPGYSAASAVGISPDGQVIVGYCVSGNSDSSERACMWTKDGSVHSLGVPDNDYGEWLGSIALATSAHGEVVVGSDALSMRAHIWTRSLGMLDLHDLLQALGVDTFNTLGAVNGVSYDGTAMFGAHPKSARPWVLTGLFCPADYNRDTFVDGIDYDEFHNDFESTDPAHRIRADLNFDGAVDAIDYEKFLNDFNAGC